MDKRLPSPICSLGSGISKPPEHILNFEHINGLNFSGMMYVLNDAYILKYFVESRPCSVSHGHQDIYVWSNVVDGHALCFGTETGDRHKEYVTSSLLKLGHPSPVGSKGLF